MTTPNTAEEQRQACRAAIYATLETLLDYEIPVGIIVEALANATLSISKVEAVRYARKRSSEAQQNEKPDDQRYWPT